MPLTTEDKRRIYFRVKREGIDYVHQCYLETKDTNNYEKYEYAAKCLRDLKSHLVST